MSPGFPIRILFSCFLALAAATTGSANAIDFKIDLPPDTGRVAVADEQDTVNIDLPSESIDRTAYVPEGEEIDTDSTPNSNSNSNDVENTNSNNSSSESANILNSMPTPPTTIVDSAPEAYDGYFPVPRCLASNVRFWEKVYREVDDNAVIFHDRDNLARIYGVTPLPISAAARKHTYLGYKNFLENKLRELAKLLNERSRWDNSHRTLANLFPGRELNATEILRAAESIRSQSGLKSRFAEGVKRSLKYLPTIQRIVRQQGLPGDIVFLPHVESSYHPQARSRAGAVGLWQLMPGTMKLLLGRSAVNRRTEIDTSTLAATKLLRQNFDTTKSWPLALTAYNHGLNGIMRAVRATGSRDLCTIIDRYQSGSFRFASSNFYAQFLAARNSALGAYTQIAKQDRGNTSLKSLLAQKPTRRL